MIGDHLSIQFFSPIAEHEYNGMVMNVGFGVHARDVHVWRTDGAANDTTRRVMGNRVMPFLIRQLRVFPGILFCVSAAHTSINRACIYRYPDGSSL